MYCLWQKRCCLRRDVCLWHVADKKAPVWVLLITRRKRREFDGFLGFLTGSCEGAYFVVRNRVRFCQKLKRSQNYDFLTFGLRAASTSSGLDIGVETGLAFTLSAFSFASSKISRIISAAASKVSRLSVSVGSNISAS